MDLNTQMKSIAVVDEQKVDILESRLPIVDKEDVLVKIRGCMLCTFEQRIFNRVVQTPLPFVPGHEIVGEIAHTGDAIDESKYPVGQKVVIKLLYSCGSCYYCRHNASNLCENGNSSGEDKNEITGMGGLGEYISVKTSQLWTVPNELDDDIAAFAEPLGCVVNSVHRADVKLGDDVVVIGGGIMGQLHIKLAKLRGARVILSEPDQERRDIGIEMGADITINPLEEDLEARIKEITTHGAEVVFDANAIPAVAQQALNLVAPMGKLILYSSIHPADDVPYNPNMIHKTEKIITGAMSPSINSFDGAVNLLAKGIIDPRKLLHKKYEFNDAQAAFEEAIKPETMRVIINFTEN